MKDKGIILSKKHGVNASLLCCEVCGKDYSLALLGKLKGDAEAPKKMYNGLCDDCKKVIDAGGALVIEVRDGATINNPYRTGRIVGITKEGKERLELPNNICYMTESVFKTIFKNLNNTNDES